MAALGSHWRALLIRPRAWWYNKVPLSILLMLVLLDGRALTLRATAALLFVLGTVCAVANHGYAVNDAFDVEEDRRVARANVAGVLGVRTVVGIAAASATCAVVLGWLAAGTAGAITTAVALSLSWAYSLPPIRLKERGWLAVPTDAAAAHVYPAGLALLAVSHWTGRAFDTGVIVCTLVWAGAVGLRGILSHVLVHEERDASAGLATVIHRHGRRRVERVLIGALLPIEVLGFAGLLGQSRIGVAGWIGTGAYLATELGRTVAGQPEVFVLRAGGQRYLPFVQEGFYKIWGPLGIGIDAARIDLRFLIVPAAYAWVFAPHLRIESGQLRGLISRLGAPTAPDARSSGGA